MSGLRERILDAAFDLTAQQGWPAVTMAAVGAAAGVSRQSVYNEFGNRQALAEALVGREVGRFLEAVDAELLAGTTPADAATRATDRVFDMAAGNPLLLAVLSAAGGSPSELLPLLTSQSAPLIDAAVAQVGATMRSRFDDLPPALDAYLDSIVRVVLSHLVQPGRADAADVAALVRQLFG